MFHLHSLIFFVSIKKEMKHFLIGIKLQLNFKENLACPNQHNLFKIFKKITKIISLPKKI
jgi:hypothetical protein